MGLGELIEVEVFVCDMGLSNVPRAKDDGGGSAHGDRGGVREIRDASGFSAVGGPQELMDEG